MEFPTADDVYFTFETEEIERVSLDELLLKEEGESSATEDSDEELTRDNLNWMSETGYVMADRVDNYQYD